MSAPPALLRRPRIRRTATLALLAAGLSVVGCEGGEPPAPPPIEIAVVEVVQRDQPITMEMVGETRGSSDIPIRARVEGVLLGMHFIEGQAVEKGQLLYTIDPEPFEAEVVEAQGARAEVQTSVVKAKADLARIRPLAEMNAVSQSDLDGAVAQYDAAIAARQAADARVKQAQIRLGYTTIHSPIEGRIGISAARVGEFVGREPNPVVLNYVSRTDPIRVRFSVDERTFLRLARRAQQLEAERGEERRAGADLQLTLADGTVHPYPGSTVARDAAVDPKTGTYTLEADFPNPESGGFVVAGQFARVTGVVDVAKDALLVPSRAVSELQGSFRVFVVEDDGTVELRPVELGPVVEGFRIIQQGLRPGEHVAVEIMRLRPGMTVVPRLVGVTADGRIVDPNDDPSGPPGAPAEKAGPAEDAKAD